MEKPNSYRKFLAVAAVILLLIIIFSVVTVRRRQNILDIQDIQNSQSAPDSHTGHDTSAASENMEGTLPEASSGPDAESNTDISPAAGSDTALNQYLTAQDNTMTNMMANMETTPSGNASINFLQGMIPHHEAAIDMAESYLKYGGTDQELKTLAEEIIDTQTAEVDQMHQLIETITASGKKEEEKEKKYLEAYQNIMSQYHTMDHGTSSHQNTEQAFADGMLMHHQMAVAMSEAILEYSGEEDVKKLAETIIDAQKKEIEQMEDILERLQGE